MSTPKSASFTISNGETRNVPLFVYRNGHPVDNPDKWDGVLWIGENEPEKWFALYSEDVKNRNIRVIAEFWWNTAPIVEDTDNEGDV